MRIDDGEFRSAGPRWRGRSTAVVAHGVQLNRLARIAVDAFGRRRRNVRRASRYFGEGLKSVDGRRVGNVRMDTRFAPDSSADQAQVQAKELIALQPDVILAQATPLVTALQRESRLIPIVFASVADPIGSGFVASLPRPGGNITGVMLYEASVSGKWLAMLKEIAPRLERAAFVINPKTAPYYKYYLRAAESLSRPLGIKLVPSLVENSADLERTIGAFARTPHGGLLLAPDASTQGPPRSHHCARDPVPFAGGLLSERLYSSRPVVSCPMGPTSLTCIGRRRPMSTASCAATSPPIFRCRRRPSSKRSSISRRREALGLTVPPGLLVAADEVIE